MLNKKTIIGLILCLAIYGCGAGASTTKMIEYRTTIGSTTLYDFENLSEKILNRNRYFIDRIEDVGNGKFIDTKMVYKTPMDEEMLQGMKELIYSFRMMNNLPPTTLIDIHQMRVVTLPDGSAEVSPEGVHQDGYDFISMIGIARHNIQGGHLLVYLNKDDENFISLPLEDGHMVTLKDDKLWHNASPIVVLDKGERGYMDAFILTTNINTRNE